jgi:hypothetical protein
MDETWIDRQEAEEKAKYKKPFDPVSFPHRHWVDNETIRYKVYSSDGEATIVEAPTAAVAAMKSGVEKPSKIERYIQDYNLEVEDEQLNEDIDTYIRPVLDALTEGSGVVGNKLLNSLNEAAHELREEQEQGETPAEPRSQYELHQGDEDAMPEVHSADPQQSEQNTTAPGAAEESDDASDEDAPESAKGPSNSLGIGGEEKSEDSVSADSDDDNPVTPPSLKDLMADDDSADDEPE